MIRLFLDVTISKDHVSIGYQSMSPVAGERGTVSQQNGYLEITDIDGIVVDGRNATSFENASKKPLRPALMSL
jgi:hypothetical protein